MHVPQPPPLIRSRTPRCDSSGLAGPRFVRKERDGGIEVGDDELGDGIGAEVVRLAETALHDRSRIGVEVVGNVDRKSTRLNSSHSQISYAVFCLKKKHAMMKYAECHLQP